MKKSLAGLVLALFVTSAQAQTTVFMDSTSLVRPTNATAYANGDIVANAADSAAMRFSNFSLYPKGFITGAYLSVDTASTSGSFRLWLFSDTTGFTKIGDNAAWTAGAVMIRTQLIGFIDFTLSSAGIGAGSGGNADFVSNVNIPYVASVTRGIFGRLTTSSAYTPKHGGRITVKLYGYSVR